MIAPCPFPHPPGSDLTAELSHDLAEGGEKIWFMTCGCGGEGPKAATEEEALELWSRGQARDGRVTILDDLASALEGAGSADAARSLTNAVAGMAAHLRLLDQPSFKIDDLRFVPVDATSAPTGYPLQLIVPPELSPGVESRQRICLETWLQRTA